MAWTARGVSRVFLPEGDRAALRERIAVRCPEAVEGPAPAGVQEAIEGIVASLGGCPADLASVPLDMEAVPEFHRRVYEVARAIPFGKVMTYGEVARRLGAPGASRAVGQALGRNPFALVVPCHRVLAAGGRPGGFSARGGLVTKHRLLSIEGYAGRERSLFEEPEPFPLPLRRPKR